jgi:hypothetical protein
VRRLAFIAACLYIHIAVAAPVIQNTCPVTGDALGGDNGPPIAIQDHGRTILLCCKSCAKKYKANPEKYAAAVKKALEGK